MNVDDNESNAGPETIVEIGAMRPDELGQTRFEPARDLRRAHERLRDRIVCKSVSGLPVNAYNQSSMDRPCVSAQHSGGHALEVQASSLATSRPSSSTTRMRAVRSCLDAPIGSSETTRW